MCEEKKKRQPLRKRKASFKMPRKAAISVRALWESASGEEKEAAHRTGVAILEMWLGQASRKEVAERLQIPPLRIWQLSQQALSGMVAGLLKQPKGRMQKTELTKEDCPWRLRKKMAKMEKELSSLRQLVGLLRDMPAHRPSTKLRKQSPVQEKSHALARRSRKMDRSESAGAKSRRGRPKSRGVLNGSDGENGTQLDEGVHEAAEEAGAAALQQGGEVPRSAGCGAAAPAAGKEGGVADDQ